MSTQSISNNYNTPLIAAASFVGLDESSSDSLTISVFLASPTLGLLTIKQSNTRGGPYQLTDTFNYGTVDTMEVYRVPSGFSFFHVEFSNAEGNQTYLSLNTYLERTFQETSVDITNVVDISGNVNVTNVVDVSGNVAVTSLPAITGTVAVSSQPHLNYQTDNIAVATMPAITGSVVVTSQPHLNYETDNIAVATMPAITGSVVVTSQPYLNYQTDNIAVATMPAITGSVVVTSQPYLNYQTDNIAVATMPAITGSVVVTSQPYLNYQTDNIAVATQPALAFSTDKVDVTGSSVIVSSMPTTTGVNLGNLITTSQLISATPKSLSGLYITHRGGTQFCFIKLYNSSSATSSDTPVATFGLYKDSMIYVDTKNLNFTTAICARGTDNYVANDNNAPSGTLDIVAFVNN